MGCVPVMLPRSWIRRLHSVDFFDMTGNTVTVVLLDASAVRAPAPIDRPAAEG